MVKIIGSVTLQHVKGTDLQFKVDDDFIVETDTHRLYIYRGFYTDGATIPRFLWCIAPPIAGKYIEAAVTHDILYLSQVFTRKQADRLFYELLLASGVPKFKAKTMYLAVRQFGGRYWNRCADYKEKHKKYIDVKCYNNSKHHCKE